MRPLIAVLAALLLAGCTEPASTGPTVTAVTGPDTAAWGSTIALRLDATGAGLVDVTLDSVTVARATVSEGATTSVDVVLARPGILRFAAGTASHTVDVYVPRAEDRPSHAESGFPQEKRASAHAVPPGYEERSSLHHGTRLVVAYAPGMPEEVRGLPVLDLEAMRDLLARAFESHWHIFDGFPHDTMTWIFAAPGDDCHETITPTLVRVCEGGGPGPSALTEEGARDWAVHEMFHAWNQGTFHHGGDGPGVLQAESWLAEGATVYYTARVNARPGSVAGYADMMQAAVETYRRHQGGELDVSFWDLAAMTEADEEGGPPRAGPHVTLLYHKGALVAQALDVALVPYGLDLDDLMRWLYDEGRGRTYTNDDIEAALEDLTGTSWQAFFAAYLHGTDGVPTDIVFVDHVHGRVLTPP